VLDLPTTQYSRIILKILAFLKKFKDTDDFKLNKFSAGGETNLIIKNCVVDNETSELGRRTNFFIDDVPMTLKICLSTQIDNENLYVIQMLHLLNFKIFEDKSYLQA